MRKKLLFGMIALTAIGAVAGERYFNLAIGQDVPLPQAEPTPKKDLFDLLKNDLEAKKDQAIAPPALPTNKDEKGAIAPSPVGDTPKSLIPPVSETPKPAKADLELPPLDKKDTSKEIAQPPSSTLPPTLPMKTQSDQLPTFPAPAPLTTDKPAANSLPTLPPQTNKEPAKLEPIKPLDYQDAPPALPSIGRQPEPSAAPPVKASTAPMAVTLPKNSPWSLHVVMVDGQTIVTATVNKKHEFKILCQTLDLQTGKGTLKASGKVQINGDALNGTCEHLSISLMEDRLFLVGPAIVIDRTSASVSDTRPASFELKADTLDLRISELQSAKADGGQRHDIDSRPVDGARMSNVEASSRVVTASMKREGMQWTPYGRLRQVKSNDSATAMWSLEGANGTVIAYLLARDGGSLERYVGQNISVYGTREREYAGQPVLRVTHIALP